MPCYRAAFRRERATGYPPLFYLRVKDLVTFPLKILKGNAEVVKPGYILVQPTYLRKPQERSPVRKRTTRVEKLLEGCIL